MSFNIDIFKLENLDNLKFPVDALYRNQREDWHPHQMNNDDGSVTFRNMGTELVGVIENGVFHMTRISCYGEGSGTVMNDMLEPAFLESTGRLIASCMWEGGRLVNRIEVNNGSIEWVNEP